MVSCYHGMAFFSYPRRHCTNGMVESIMPFVGLHTYAYHHHTISGTQ